MAVSVLAGFDADRSPFPTDFTDPAPAGRKLPRAYAWLALLLMAAFVPRALMAWKVDLVTEDGPTYIYAAMQLERGDLNAAFRDSNLGLNFYPAVLAALHQLGVPWELAGRLWGMATASLVVLPMFGWVRRQFSDRVALIGCLLYAAHPGLLERSPELLRCSTFWLLFMTTVYFLWRAVTEQRVALFVWAGACFSLGVHFRIEMWFLLVPWLLWTIGRCFYTQQHRGRLLVGCVLGLLVLPALTLLLNVTWLRHQAQWEWCLAQRFRVVPHLLATDDANPKTPSTPGDSTPAQTAPGPGAAAAATPSATTPAPPAANPVAFAARGHVPRAAWTPREFIASYLQKLIDGIDPLFGILLLAGLWVWRQELLRFDQAAMIVFSTVCLAAVVAFLWLVHDIQGRYFFPIVLISTAYAALGVLELGRIAAHAAQRFLPAFPLRATAASVGILAAVLMIGCGDALTNQYDDRLVRRELGKWIFTSMGPGQLILGSEPRGWALAYYAQSHYYGPSQDELRSLAFQEQARSVPPSIVVVTARRGPAEQSAWYQQFLADKALAAQYQAIPASCLPPTIKGMLVLVRTPAWQQTVRRAARTSRER